MARPGRERFPSGPFLSAVYFSSVSGSSAGDAFSGPAGTSAFSAGAAAG